MGKIKKSSLVAIACIAISPIGNCFAAERSSFVRPVAGQEVSYERGDAYVTSSNENSTVVFALRFESKTLARLHFTIVNDGAVPTTILGTAVAARIDGKMVEVLGSEALARIEKRKRAFENLMVGLAAGANAYAGAQQQTTEPAPYERTPRSR